MTKQVGVGVTISPPLPIDTFQVVLDRRSTGPARFYKPGDQITGKVLLNNSEPFHCDDIRVVLEGHAIVNYRSGQTVRTKTEDLLPYDWTAIYFVGYKSDYPPSDPNYRPPMVHNVEKSNYVYKFAIPIRKLNPFPGTFKGSSGEIVYKVVGYVNTGSVINTRVSKQTIKISSYFNLRSVPSLLKPTCLEKQQNTSIFSSSTGIKFSLHLSRIGFLPDDQVSFHLTLLNPNKKKVTKVSVSLLKKLTWRSDLTSKSSKVSLSSRDNINANLAQPKSLWEEALDIPKDAYISITGIIQHHYFIVVEVYTNNSGNPELKSDIPVTIGTTIHREREIENLQSEEDDAMARSSSLTFPTRTVSASAVPSSLSHSQLSNRRPSRDPLPTVEDEAAAEGVENLKLDD